MGQPLSVGHQPRPGRTDLFERGQAGIVRPHLHRRVAASPAAQYGSRSIPQRTQRDTASAAGDCRPASRIRAAHSSGGGRRSGGNPRPAADVPSSHGEITLVWKLSSTTGANIGSLRAHAIAAEASTADTIVVAFGLCDASLKVTRLSPDAGGMRRLRHLLGRTVRNPAAALAAGLQCKRSEVTAVLRARGDHELASGLRSSETP
jgi:hypothetical protein